jgi:hypothetical protein
MQPTSRLLSFVVTPSGVSSSCDRRAPERLTASLRTTRPAERRGNAVVAQVSNLLYRRLPVGRALVERIAAIPVS